MKQADLGEFAARLGITLGEAQAGSLERFEHLLCGPGRRAGVVAAGDLERVRERHILDCLRVITEAEGAAEALDLGSGGGLPGIVVAITMPDLRVGLVERRRRKAAFLEFVVTELGLTNARVLPGEAEQLRDQVDLCFARALADVGESWALADPLLRPGGRLIYFGGKGFGHLPDLPHCAGVRQVPSPMLESAGPLVIMTRE